MNSPLLSLRGSMHRLSIGLLTLIFAPHAAAEPLLVLWQHEQLHCIEGVDPLLCEIAQQSETSSANDAVTKLLELESQFEADPNQRPAYRSLLYRATQQMRMNVNGSAATDTADDPDGIYLDSLRQRAVDAFDAAPFEDLPYLPMPLMGLIDEVNSAEYQAMTERASVATHKMRTPLNLEAVSFLSYLGMHRGHADPAGGIVILRNARNKMPIGTWGTSMTIALLINEASILRWEQNWGMSSDSSYGLAALIEALTLLQETADLASEDFRNHLHRVADQLQLQRSYTREKSDWSDESENSLLKAEAIVKKLKRRQPKDAIKRSPN